MHGSLAPCLRRGARSRRDQKFCYFFNSMPRNLVLRKCYFLLYFFRLALTRGTQARA